jgi:hypothetical protein
LAIVGVASDDISNSTARRRVIFIVHFLNNGFALPEDRLTATWGYVSQPLVRRLKRKS